jgi:hypothetical protein
MVRQFRFLRWREIELSCADKLRFPAFQEGVRALLACSPRRQNHGDGIDARDWTFWDGFRPCRFF